MEENNIVEPIVNNDIIDSVRSLVEDENHSIAFYNMLLNQVTDEEDVSIISDIMKNEVRHSDILKDVFYEITSTHISDTRSIYVENRCIIDNYPENLKNGLFDEINSIKKYRNIQNSMPDNKKYNMINEIITNKLCNVNMYNYLISKNIHK